MKNVPVPFFQSVLSRNAEALARSAQLRAKLVSIQIPLCLAGIALGMVPDRIVRFPALIAKRPLLMSVMNSKPICGLDLMKNVPVPFFQSSSVERRLRTCPHLA